MTDPDHDQRPQIELGERGPNHSSLEKAADPLVPPGPNARMRLVRDNWQPRCPRCGYPLASVADGPCPECGTPFSISLLRAAHLQRDPRPWVRRLSWFEGVGAVLIAACYCAYVGTQSEHVRPLLLVFNGGLAGVVTASVVLTYVQRITLAVGVALFASTLWLYPFVVADSERWYISFGVWAFAAAAMAHQCIAIRPRMGAWCCDRVEPVRGLHRP